VAKRKIDFGGVDPEIKRGAGKAARVPEGDYLLKIVEGDFRKSESKGSRYISWRFQIVSPAEFKGKTVYDITSLKPESLWSLRNLIHAATGKNVAGKSVNFDPSMIEGKIVAATLYDDEQTQGKGKGTIRSRPTDYRPKDELGDEEEDESEEEEVEEEEGEETTEEEDEELEDVDLEDL